MLVDQPLINSLLATYLQQREIFYLGKAYANDVLYPMWFKHFGPGVRGAGESLPYRSIREGLVQESPV